MKTLLLTLSSRMAPIAGWQAVLLRIRADDHDHARRLVSAVKPHLTGDTAVTWSVKDEPEPGCGAPDWERTAKDRADVIARLKDEADQRDREIVELRARIVVDDMRRPRDLDIARNQLAAHKDTIASMEDEIAHLKGRLAASEATVRDLNAACNRGHDLVRLALEVLDKNAPAAVKAILTSV